ncbi:MAG: hypothetical protein ABIC18_04550 [Candidatus Omnitrophota bacterium]
MDIKGLVTGIGSLPFKDADRALDLIFKHMPEIPFWPQLPRKDMREGMLAQFSQGLPCLRLSENGLSFDASMQEEELGQFYERIIADDKEYFKISSEFADGLWQFLYRLEKEDINRIEFIKGQVTGPFTFAASINDNTGKAMLHNSVFFQAAQEGLAMKARWQIDLFSKFGKPMIMFFDEPYLTCLGSGFTSINREDVVGGLTEFTKKIKSPNCLVGVHCCGNTDWSVFTDVPYIDIINFDAFNFLDRVLLYAEELLGFFKRGGMLAWGIVPTDSFDSQAKAVDLLRRLNTGMDSLVKKGIGRDLLERGMILTPSCGLGTLDPGKVELIFKCLTELSLSLQAE